MKMLCVAIAATLLCGGVCLGGDGGKSNAPELTLFQSVEIIRTYLQTKAQQDYSDRYLQSVRYHWSEGNPRKGACWLYSFAFKKPRLGGDISIYHFMDGEIIEFHHGP